MLQQQNERQHEFFLFLLLLSVDFKLQKNGKIKKKTI